MGNRIQEFRLERVKVNEISDEIMHDALKDEDPMSQDMSVMAKCEAKKLMTICKNIMR